MKYFLLFLSILGCAKIDKPHSYLVHEDNRTCEGSYLELSEQVNIMKEVAGNYGYNCEALPIPLEKGRIFYRVFCNSAAGKLPGHEGIAKDKETCNLALEALQKDPHLGFGKETIQAQEASWWMADFKDSSCVLLGPVSMEEVVTQLEARTKKICKVAQIDETLADLRTIVCGKKAFVITGTEELCQKVISAKNSTPPPGSQI